MVRIKSYKREVASRDFRSIIVNGPRTFAKPLSNPKSTFWTRTKVVRVRSLYWSVISLITWSISGLSLQVAIICNHLSSICWPR